MRTRVPTVLGLVLFLLFAGCASVPPTTQSEQLRGHASHADGVAGSSSDGKATSSTTGSTAKIATKSASPGAKPSASTPLSSVSASQPSKKNSIASELTKQKASPPLDFTSLEKRLKGTSAIDILDKIAFRNQVDDLVGQFRAFYEGKLNTTLVQLRRPYDLLVVELLALLGDKDPSLAAAVVASREAIWAILADPARFSAI